SNPSTLTPRCSSVICKFSRQKSKGKRWFGRENATIRRNTAKRRAQACEKGWRMPLHPPACSPPSPDRGISSAFAIAALFAQIAAELHARPRGIARIIAKALRGHGGKDLAQALQPIEMVMQFQEHAVDAAQIGL